MSATVIQHLLIMMKENMVGVAYIFCEYTKAPTATNLMRSILRQLVEQLPALPHDVDELYTDVENRKMPETSGEIMQLLESVSSIFSRTFVVVDALDELVEVSRTKFTHCLLNIKAFASVLITSRPIPAIANQFSSDLFQEISAKKEDLKAYVESEIESRASIAALVLQKPDLRPQIVSKVEEKARGMFVYQSLVDMPF